jgi:hypothetical protein
MIDCNEATTGMPQKLESLLFQMIKSLGESRCQSTSINDTAKTHLAEEFSTLSHVPWARESEVTAKPLDDEHNPGSQTSTA